MVRRVCHAVRLALACAAVCAQAVAPAFGRECERACCAAVTNNHGSAIVAPTADCCSLETAPGSASLAEAGCPADAAADPCHCRLEPRQDEPLAARRDAPSGSSVAQAAASAGAAFDMPQSLGVSREYLAATRAAPIRPTRILFGVWRN